MKFTIYTKSNCGYCVKAKELIEKTGNDYVEVVFPDQVSKEELQNKITESGSDIVLKTVPQIFVDSEYIGGYKELVEHLSY